MTYAWALLASAIPVGVGAGLLFRVGLYGHMHVALFVGLAYGLGLAVISFVLATLPVLGIPLTLLWALPSIGLAWGALWFATGRFGKHVESVPTSTPVSARGLWMRAVWAVGLALLVAKLGLIGVRAMDKPVIGWDAVTTHSLRAKAMYYDQTIARSSLDWIGSAEYPMGLPLLELWVNWFQGRWDDTAFKMLFPGFLAALLAMFYGALRDSMPALGALVGVWFVASLPLLVQHATDAYVDLPLAYTTLGVSIFLWRYARTAETHNLFLASVMAALGVWFKREGAVAFGIDLALLALWSITFKAPVRAKPVSALAAFAALPALVWVAWAVVRWTAFESAPLSFQPSPVSDLFSRALAVAAYASGELWRSSNWNVLWPLFFGVWLFHARRSLDPDILFFAWPVVMTLAAFLATSAGTVMFDYLMQGSTLHRMVLHVAPLAAFSVALMVGRDWEAIRARSLRARG